MELVAADWLKSDKREDDLGGRSGGIIQVSHISQHDLQSEICFFKWHIQKSFKTYRNMWHNLAMSFSSSLTYR